MLKQAKPKVRELSVVSKAQVAERFGDYRARVYQMLNLLELDNRIIHYLQSIKDVDEHNFFTEHRLRRIAVMDKDKQIVEFNDLRQEACQEANLL
jgi:hypothetical protein